MNAAATMYLARTRELEGILEFPPNQAISGFPRVPLEPQRIIRHEHVFENSLKSNRSRRKARWNCRSFAAVARSTHKDEGRSDTFRRRSTV